MAEGVFRFSNAVSDLDKFIDTYKKIYHHFITKCEAGEYFNHVEAAAFLALNGLATSLGAVGAEALSRSTRDDRSRDPLYNQHKSYSEIFRMLGWYEPGNMQTNFRLTEYGGYIADCDINSPHLKMLVCLNFLHIVSPNPVTAVKGNNILRPFPLIIKLMERLGGVIFRDEMILGVLACADDTKTNIVEQTSEYILEIRNGGHQRLMQEFTNLMERQGMNSDATLRNYTRLPISTMKWSGWATPVTIKKFYGVKASKMLSLTESGYQLAKQISEAVDIRDEYLSGYEEEERCAFVALSNLSKLSKIGFDLGVYTKVMPLLIDKCQHIYRDFNINGDQYIYFGYQEAPREILQKADLLLEELL